jgi:hypothetical protein
MATVPLDTSPTGPFAYPAPAATALPRLGLEAAA